MRQCRLLGRPFAARPQRDELARPAIDGTQLAVECRNAFLQPCGGCALGHDRLQVSEHAPELGSQRRNSLHPLELLQLGLRFREIGGSGDELPALRFDAERQVHHRQADVAHVPDDRADLVEPDQRQPGGAERHRDDQPERDQELGGNALTPAPLAGARDLRVGFRHPDHAFSQENRIAAMSSAGGAPASKPRTSLTRPARAPASFGLAAARYRSIRLPPNSSPPGSTASVKPSVTTRTASPGWNSTGADVYCALALIPRGRPACWSRCSIMPSARRSNGGTWPARA